MIILLDNFLKKMLQLCSKWLIEIIFQANEANQFFQVLLIMFFPYAVEVFRKFSISSVSCEVVKKIF